MSRRRFWLMARVVTFVAILVGIVIGFWLRKAIRPDDATPPGWARQQALSCSEWTREAAYKSPRWQQAEIAERGAVEVGQLRELADVFESYGEVGPIGNEVTIRGPFSELLAIGEEVITRQGMRDEPPSRQGASRDGIDRHSLRDGTTCVVVAEIRGDTDDCDPLRMITVRVVDGPYRGTLLSIERIYLRRKHR